MDISIIVLTKNAGDRFETLLQCLFSQKFNGDYEVIVIDSGSSDNTVAVAQRFPVKINIVRAEEFHHGKTRNLGAELSNGKTLVYITQDALPLYDNWLQKLTEDLQDPKVAMVVGRQISWPDAKPPEKYFYDFYFPPHRVEVVHNASDYYRDNMFISNVNSAIKREVWQTFRFLENIVGGEDKEFARRILLADWKIVYRPDAVVYHSHDLNLRLIFRKSIDSGMVVSQEVNVPRSKNWMIQRLEYFIKETWFIISGEDAWKWLPYSVLYECTKLLGISVGWVIGKFLALLNRIGIESRSRT